MGNKPRLSNYELLRLLAGMGVVVLHFNYIPGGEGALNNATGSTFVVLMLFEVIFVCAVNVFILFSGYFGGESDSINFSKLLGLIIQTVCFRIVIILVDCLLHHELELKRILLSLFPVNYFVVLYVVLMILAPYINRLISTLSTKAFTTLVIILFSIFSVYVTFVDVMKEVSLDELQGLSSVGLYGSMNGYSIVNFVLVYIIGVWLKRNNIVDKVKTRHVILGLLISVLAIYALRMFSDSALNYSNPILIIEGCLYFCLFGKLKISSKVINSLAKASFTSFLINSNILGFVGDRFIANKSTLVIVLALVFETLLIYGLGYVAMLLWNLISKPFFKLVINKIPIYKLKTVK